MPNPDEYISIGGRTKDYDRNHYIQDVMCLGSFMVWQYDNEVSGGYRAKDAYQAMCRLLDIHPVKLRKALKVEG